MDKRPLTQKERAILDKLLSVSFPGVDELRNQLKDCTAKGTGDNDNYRSIYLFPHATRRAEVSLRVPVEGLVDDSDKSPIDILLHVVDGFANELEIVKLDGTPIKADFDPTRIKVVINE